MVKQQSALENVELIMNLDFYKNKKVLITGHAGFKGSWLCEVLINAGAEVCGYSLNPSRQPGGLFGILGLNDKMYSVDGDIRDLTRLRYAFSDINPDIVIHMAAQPLVLESYKNPVFTYETNVLGTLNVLECVRNCHSVRSVLNVTTDKVYQNVNKNEGYKEDDKLCGYDPYANSKSCSELVTYSYKKSFFEALGIPVSTVRSGNVIAGGDFSKDRIIPDCYRAAAAGESVILRNPASVRPYQHVLDTLSAYLTVAAAQFENPALADSYNIGPAENDCATTEAITEMFVSFWGGKPYQKTTVETPHEDGLLRLGCEKIKNTLGWTPKWDIKEAVRATAEWYKAYSEGNDITDKQIKDFFAE
jgi:CDP-glucose 4,6-dehydratase